MSTRSFLVALAVACVTTSIASAEQGAPPKAPVRPVVDAYQDTKVSDPYRYLENLKDPEVQAWVKAQAEYTAAALGQIPGRNQLLERIKEFDAATAFRVRSVMQLADGTLFFRKQPAAAKMPKLFVRDPKTKNDQLLIDPELIKSSDDQHFALEFYLPSPSGKHVLYGLAKGGSEQITLHVLETASKRELPDVIDRIENAYSIPTWLSDESGFVYARRQLLAPGAPATDGFKNSRVYLHRLGSDPNQDALVLGVGTSPAVKLVDTDFPSVIVPRGATHAVAQIKQGDNNELALYSAAIDQLGKPNTAWQKICDFSDQVEDYAVLGNTIYLKTAKDAPRYQVVATPLDRPDLAKASVVVPAGDAVIDGLAAAKDAIYLNVLDGGQELVQRYDVAKRKVEPLPLPDGWSGYISSASTQVAGVLVDTASYIKGKTIVKYDPATRQWSDTGLQPKGAFDDVAGYVVDEVKVKSHDGTLVPLSIVHQTGIKLDGNNPTLLEGYGAYGMSWTPWFDPTLLAWLERGGVWAVAHVRGGGEYGKPWHEAGRMLTKPNTWKDFIACGQYLIDKKFTSASRLAGRGGSAGGILIGRAITERPDLFGAGIDNVGMSDTVRAETTTNGVPNIQEFGTVKTADGFKGLYEMSALHHVVDKTRYPAVLLTHGINDPRVDPWMSFKMAARLQAATASKKPVLLRVDYDAGHGIGSTKLQYQEEMADTFAFLLWQFGDKDFQPKATKR